MSDALVQLEFNGAVAMVTLNRPAQRNALSIGMFDALDAALDEVRGHRDSVAVLLIGAGPAFCAGFDLKEAVEHEGRLARFIERLSVTLRTLRRLDSIVVAAVHGWALAGGCALLSACDFVFVAADSQLGYPVHRIGVSPAVSIPTLRQIIGDGQARALLMSGQIIDGRQARAIGLASNVVEHSDDVVREARAFCEKLATKGAVALCTTKRWLNELDGSLDDGPFDAVVEATTGLCDEPEARDLIAPNRPSGPT